MAIRIETRVVETGKAALSQLINKRPALVWWITVCGKNTSSLAKLQIYNGMDAGGDYVWATQNRAVRHYRFDPPIPCGMGIFVVSDSNVELYTIAFEPIRKTPHKG